MPLFGSSGHEPKGRRKHSHASPNASKPRPVVHNSPPEPSVVHIEPLPPQYPPPVPPVPAQYADIQSRQDPGYASSPPHHRVYEPHAGQSTISFATSPPKDQDAKHGLESKWNRVDRLAAKSYSDLRGQLSSSANKSVTMLATTLIDKPSQIISKKSTQALNQGAALCDLICTKLDAVITSIDGERFSGKEQDLMVYENDQTWPNETLPCPPSRGSQTPSTAGSNHFTKVWLYSNSRLPPHLPPFKVYMPTYPLLCLAASYSERVYTPPAPLSSETETHIPSDWRSGTKAMVLKAVPIDDMNTVVFAIRGSQTFMDWAVNYRSDPTAPTGFLDDDGNLCHAGFLYVARKMIRPVADKLRTLLQENPSRAHCSLLITGHSAGGAVAALLYAHMMSAQIESELSYLTGFFKRVHCVTFGAPPVSLLPLRRSDEKRHRKSLFYAFVNEGDPVPRADKSVVRSLLKLYASPAPNMTCLGAKLVGGMSRLNVAEAGASKDTLETSTDSTAFSCSNGGAEKSSPGSKAKTGRFRRPSKTSLNTVSTTASSAPTWPIPPCTLSPAGRLVVLRRRPGARKEGDVEAVTVDDELLRSVVYGDPLMHTMTLYKKRIEGIAVRAVTVGGY